MLRVIGSKAWHGLQRLTIPSVRHVDFQSIDDMQHGYHPPVFPHAQSISVRDCDKNWVYYHVNKDFFPRVTQLVLFSHPCEPPVAFRFKKTFIADGYYRQYLDRWWTKQNTHIVSVPLDVMLNYWKILDDNEIPPLQELLEKPSK